MVNQRTWRAAGVVVLICAGLMAWYASNTGLLRDTALRGAALFSDRNLDDPDASLGFILFYWGLFGVVILAALYLALIDIRFVRLRHALERRELLRETVDEAPAENLAAARPRDEDS